MDPPSSTLFVGLKILRLKQDLDPFSRFCTAQVRYRQIHHTDGSQLVPKSTR